MKKLSVIVVLLGLLTAFAPATVPGTTPDDVCLSAEEMKLYNMVMDYRKSKGLPKIPISKSLSHVAQVHAEDLVKNRPDTGQCNLHSWSDKGEWTACCYTPDHARVKCVKRKPLELTSYKYYSYEISHYSSVGVTAEKALRGWQNSPGHNAMMVNEDNWADYDWQAIGIGLRGNYAHIWFGDRKDPAGTASACE